MRISTRKRIFSYPYPRRKHNRHLVSIQSNTKSLPSFPKFRLRHVRSMVNKINEIQGVISTNKCDILVLSESWLTPKVTNDLIAIPDHNHIRKDRPNDQRGGGICTYLKRFINFLHLHEFDDPCLETERFQLKPNRLPREFNSIIMTTILVMTCGNITLDQIYTSLGMTLLRFYRPPIGKSDHACVLLNPKMYCANSLPSRRTFERSCRPFETKLLQNRYLK